MTQPASADLQLLVSREQGRNALAKALRLFVGRGRRYSVKQLANGSGVPDWQINTAMIEAGHPDNRPLPPESLLSIMFFLGADFTNEIICLVQQGAFDFPDDDVCPGALAADNCDDNASIVRAAMDGEFCDDESSSLACAGGRMMTRGAQLISLQAKRKAA